MKWTCDAEHTSGGSVGHACTRGVYSDPTESWTAVVKADSISAAVSAGLAELRAHIDDWEPCNCVRKSEPGYTSWWNSVCVRAWPLDREAMAVWAAEIEQLRAERLLMAKLAAKEPQFNNPMVIWEAEKLRDRILGIKA